MPATRRLKAAGAFVALSVLAGVQCVDAGQQQLPQFGAAQPTVALPDAEKVVLLIRTALLTLNDAVQTGNFTVLRDKAAPNFQVANSAARLSLIFQSLSQQRTDFSVVAVQTPQLTQAPVIDPQGRLRLAGYVPGRLRLDFDLVFEAVEGRWRIFGISANLRPGTPEPAATGSSGAAKGAPAASTPAAAKK